MISRRSSSGIGLKQPVFWTHYNYTNIDTYTNQCDQTNDPVAHNTYRIITATSSFCVHVKLQYTAYISAYQGNYTYNTSYKLV